MSAVALGHTVAGQRVGRPVARTSPAAPWPGQGLRLEGSLGMLLLRSWIPSRWDVELDGTDFPMLRQMLFHAPLSLQVCRRKQGLRKKVHAGVCASAVGEAQTRRRQSIPLRLRPWKKKSLRGCVTPVTHTWQHNIREERTTALYHRVTC